MTIPKASDRRDLDDRVPCNCVCVNYTIAFGEDAADVPKADPSKSMKYPHLFNFAPHPKLSGPIFSQQAFICLYSNVRSLCKCPVKFGSISEFEDFKEQIVANLIIGLNWGPIDSISATAKISLMCSRLTINYSKMFFGH